MVAASVFAAGAARGVTWTRGDLPVGSVAQVAAHPTLPGIAFVSTSSGSYRSTDRGLHWQRVTDLRLIAFAFNPFRQSEVCAVSTTFNSEGGYCSTDLGLNWSPLSGGGFSFLVFDWRVPHRMYSGTGYGNQWIAVSDDHGKSFILHGFTAGHPNFHAYAATDLDSAIYEVSAPHGPGCFSCALYRSRDSGDTWELIDVGPSEWTVAIDTAGRSALYTASDDWSRPPGSERAYTIRASTDGGTTWVTRGVLQTTSYLGTPLATDPANNLIVYAAGDSGSVYRSADGGRTWKRIDDVAIHQVPESAPSASEFNRVISMSVGIEGTVYAITRDALFVTASAERRHAVKHR